MKIQTLMPSPQQPPHQFQEAATGGPPSLCGAAQRGDVRRREACAVEHVRRVGTQLELHLLPRQEECLARRHNVPKGMLLRIFAGDAF